MGKIDVTTQELFLRLGTTSQSRSARADALFRRLRSAERNQLADDLMTAPKRMSPPDRAGRKTDAPDAPDR